MIITLSKKASQEEIKKASQEFKNYIKIVIDIKKEKVVIGGKLHADCEKVLLMSDSKQDDVWGGGLDLETKRIDSQAVINLRPNLNNDNLEILNSEIREKFIKIANKYLL